MQADKVFLGYFQNLMAYLNKAPHDPDFMELIEEYLGVNVIPGDEEGLDNWRLQFSKRILRNNFDNFSVANDPMLHQQILQALEENIELEDYEPVEMSLEIDADLISYGKVSDIITALKVIEEESLEFVEQENAIFVQSISVFDLTEMVSNLDPKLENRYFDTCILSPNMDCSKHFQNSYMKIVSQIDRTKNCRIMISVGYDSGSFYFFW